uniref:Uncharacterized protein n=1 Tax=Romanomermis culicivorax TaxID=13658 RepID=A0A915JYI3_ROMCU
MTARQNMFKAMPFNNSKKLSDMGSRNSSKRLDLPMEKMYNEKEANAKTSSFTKMKTLASNKSLAEIRRSTLNDIKRDTTMTSATQKPCQKPATTPMPCNGKPNGKGRPPCNGGTTKYVPGPPFPGRPNNTTSPRLPGNNLAKDRNMALRPLD